MPVITLLPHGQQTRRIAWIALTIAGALALASAAPIHNPDYWWNLAAGRWIVEHGQLPQQDPFGLASAPVRWVNGEWLFQIALYLLYSVGGHSAVSIALAIGIGLLFGGMFLIVARRTGIAMALPVILISWYGAWEWLRERPATMGAVFLVVLLLVLQFQTGTKRLLGVAVLTAVWINAHPSALIAPIVSGLFVLGEAIERRTWKDRIAVPLTALVALLANPYGLEGIRGPFRLTRVIGLFNNSEWMPSTPAAFAFFYVTLVLMLTLHAYRHFVEKRPGLSETLVLLFLAAIAIRHCRNQGLFWASAPLLVAGSLPSLQPRLKPVFVVATAVAYCAILSGAHFSTAVDSFTYPVAAVKRLREAGLQGNIYTQYSMGGFLIWSFYPERRVVTDGRNELYVDYEREHLRALQDGDRWNALIRRHDLRIAFFSRRDKRLLEVPDRRTGRIWRVPATVAYFPPDRWALVAREPAVLVFARRDAFPADQLRRLELSRSGF